jgi:regulator of replication initiation timing
MTERQMDGDWERVTRLLANLEDLVTTTLAELVEENAKLRAENAELRLRLAADQQRDGSES